MGFYTADPYTSGLAKPVARPATPGTNKRGVSGTTPAYQNADPGSGLFPTSDPLNSLKNDMTHVNDRVSDQDLWDATRGLEQGTGFQGMDNTAKQLDFVTGAGGQPPPAAPVGGPPQIDPTGAGGPGGGGGGVGPLEGLDFTKPGALEQYQKDTGDYFKQPTMSEMFAQDTLNKGTGPGVSNRAEDAYQKFSGSSPANMDPYYENERRKALEAINRATAARGVYGSSAANDMNAEAITNLGADQAKAEAQYGLQRGSLLGSLAQGADSSSAAGSRDRLNWTSALSSIANGADASGLSRVVSGANVAGAAQGAQTTRGQNAINNQLAIGDRESGIMGHGYDNIFGADMGLLKDIVGLNTGTGTEGYNQASNNATRNRMDVSNDANLRGNNLTYAKGVSDLFKDQSSPQPSPLPSGQQPYYGPPSGQNYGTTNYYDPRNP